MDAGAIQRATGTCYGLPRLRRPPRRPPADPGCISTVNRENDERMMRDESVIRVIGLLDCRMHERI